MDNAESQRVAETEHAEAAVDWTTMLPAELQHAIVASVADVCLVSTVRLCLVSRTTHAAVEGARMCTETWTRSRHTCVPVLALVRLAYATGVCRIWDATTALALSVMRDYVVAAIRNDRCWYQRGVASEDLLYPNECVNPVDWLGLPSLRRISPHALVHWITANHHTVVTKTVPGGAPVLLPNLPRDGPTKMCKYQRGTVHTVIRMASSDARVHSALNAVYDLDLLFGATSQDLTTVVDLPARTVKWFARIFACHCPALLTCETCQKRKETTDALMLPDAHRRTIEWLDTRVAAQHASQVVACFRQHPELSAAFGDLFEVSDLHVASNTWGALFFGVVTARFDVPSFVAAASRLSFCPETV